MSIVRLKDGGQALRVRAEGILLRDDIVAYLCLWAFREDEEFKPPILAKHVVLTTVRDEFKDGGYYVLEFWGDRAYDEEHFIRIKGWAEALVDRHFPELKREMVQG